MAGLLPQAEPPCIAPPKAMHPPSRPPDRRAVALVGMMGAGKSTIGAALARRLALPFADSDEEIERRAGVGIARLFEERGEAWFRERERIVTADLLAGPPLVLATGGGAMTDPGTRRLLLDRAITIWLDAEPSVLAARLAGGGGRPLLRDGDPVETLTRLNSERRRDYRRARIHIPTDRLNIPATVEAAAHALAALTAA